VIILNSSMPSKSLFYIGSNIISFLKKNLKDSYDPLELFSLYNEYFENISLPYFYYSLDWLFIIDFLNLTETGDLIICK